MVHLGPGYNRRQIDYVLRHINVGLRVEWHMNVGLPDGEPVNGPDTKTGGTVRLPWFYDLKHWKAGRSLLNATAGPSSFASGTQFFRA